MGGVGSAGALQEQQLGRGKKVCTPGKLGFRATAERVHCGGHRRAGRSVWWWELRPRWGCGSEPRHLFWELWGTVGELSGGVAGHDCCFEVAAQSRWRG